MKFLKSATFLAAAMAVIVLVFATGGGIAWATNPAAIDMTAPVSVDLPDRFDQCEGRETTITLDAGRQFARIACSTPSGEVRSGGTHLTHELRIKIR